VKCNFIHFDRTAGTNFNLTNTSVDLFNSAGLLTVWVHSRKQGKTTKLRRKTH